MLIRLVIAFLICTLAAQARAAQPTTLPVDPARSFIHKASGLQFPPTVARFQRLGVTQYGQDDISVAYRLSDLGISATIDLLPNNGQDPGLQFQRIVRTMERLFPGIKKTGQSETTFTQGEREIPAYLATFSIPARSGGKPQEIRCRVYLVMLKSVFVKYRFTYPAAENDAPEQSIAAFLVDLRLPEKK